MEYGMMLWNMVYLLYSYVFYLTFRSLQAIFIVLHFIVPQLRTKVDKHGLIIRFFPKMQKSQVTSCFRPKFKSYLHIEQPDIQFHDSVEKTCWTMTFWNAYENHVHEIKHLIEWIRDVKIHYLIKIYYQGCSTNTYTRLCSLWVLMKWMEQLILSFYSLLRSH